MNSLRIISYNIHKGFSTGNRNFVLHEIREALQKSQVDIIFLQEVLGEHQGHTQRIPTYPNQSQFEFLAQDIFPHYAYGKNAVYTAGHHGNAILSKYPFALWENIDISTNKLERRGLLHGWIRVPGHERHLHLICVHLGLLETERQSQIERLCMRIESHVPHSDPLIIAGDFNDWRGKISPILKKKLELREAFSEVHGAPAKTFPSWFPTLRLDRIYHRGLQTKIAKKMVGLPWSKLSDHVALYAELAI